MFTFIIYPNYQQIDTFFTEHVLLWNEYIQYVFDSNVVLIGTDQSVLPDLLTQVGLRDTLHSHNQYVTMLVFNGMIIVVFFILITLLSVPKKVKRLLPADTVLFTIITILFAESLIPLFDFFFLSFVFIMNLLINRLLNKPR